MEGTVIAFLLCTRIKVTSLHSSSNLFSFVCLHISEQTPCFLFMPLKLCVFSYDILSLCLASSIVSEVTAKTMFFVFLPLCDMFVSETRYLAVKLCEDACRVYQPGFY